ncbi:MAG: hypothetical protein VX278_01830 [Myxococcota bacterium]|nr:hypothetical protein [Myxococcota bacterium]
MSSPNQPSASVNGASILMALLGPLLVLGVFAFLLVAPTKRTEIAELQAMEEAVRTSEPTILFVGSSLLGRGIDGEMVEEQLGVPVHVMWRANASTPEWYAMLKNRVYQQGLKPDLVLIPSTLKRMMLTKPRGDRQTMRLKEQLGEYEPVIQRKVFGQERDDTTLGRMRFRRTKLKDQILNQIKGLSIMLTSASAKSISEGIDEADPALERVFGGENARDFDLDARVIPVVDTRMADDQKDGAKDQEDVAESDLLADFAALVEENGARLVFVNLPVTKGLQTNRVSREMPSRSEQQRAFRKMKELGLGYIDVSDLDRLGLKKSDFRDATHLGVSGQKVVTRALIDILKTADILRTEKPLPLPQGVDITETWSRSGVLQGLPKLKLRYPEAEQPCRAQAALGPVSQKTYAIRRSGLPNPLYIYADGQPITVTSNAKTIDFSACEGTAYFGRRGLLLSLPTAGVESVSLALNPSPEVEADGEKVVWLVPGTTVTLRFRGIAQGSKPYIKLVGTAVGDSQAPAVVQRDSQVRPMENKESLWYTQSDLDCRGDDCQISFSSPKDGPWIAIQNVDLHVDKTQKRILGTGFEGAFQTSINLLGDKDLPPHTSNPPPTISLKPAISLDKRGFGVMEIPELEWLSNHKILRRTHAKHATPLLLLEDGQPMELQSCRDLRKKTRPGIFCERDKKLHFVSSDDRDPTADPSRYRIALRADRRNRGWWIYPGDTLTFGRSPKRLGVFQRAPDSIQLRIWSFRPDVEKTESTTLQVRSGENILLDTMLDANSGDGVQRWTLSEGFSSEVDLVVTIASSPEQQGYYFLQSAELAENLLANDGKDER